MGIILRIWVKSPIYHLPGTTVRIGDRWFDFTLCGRKVGEYNSWFPMRHLLKFARLCKDCERRAEV